ncbi:MAG: hypothetical protein C0483_18430 [Pirellula sp.]|nr:hypothetical protein [Pirellula sp.]
MSPQDRYTAEGLDTLAAFIDVDDEPEAALPELDRSELEGFSLCPAAAVIREQKLVVDGSNATNSGNEVHAVLSAAITEWIDTQGWMGGEQGSKQVGYARATPSVASTTGSCRRTFVRATSAIRSRLARCAKWITTQRRCSM